MKTEAWYKVYSFAMYSDIVLLSFKIDNLIFSFDFYCKKPPHCIISKQIGVKVLEQLVLGSTYISLKDHLSGYVFEKQNGNLVNISENKILIGVANRMRRVIKNFEYDTKENLKDQTEAFYNKIWNTKHFTKT